jgi:hypothetical protein
MTIPPKRPGYALRLWVISLALSASGFVCRLALDESNVAWLYPASTSLQALFFGTGLMALLLWVAGQARSGRARAIGGLCWVALAVISAIAMLSSIPK